MTDYHDKLLDLKITRAKPIHRKVASEREMVKQVSTGIQREISYFDSTSSDDNSYSNTKVKFKHNLKPKLLENKSHQTVFPPLK
jgi:hypothetical protein